MNRLGEVIEVTNDKGPHKLVKVRCEDKEYICKVWESDGASSSPLKGSECLISPVNGDEGQWVATIGAPPDKRVDGQKPGEKTYMNHATGSNIKHSENGDTTITTSQHMNVNSNGDVIIKSSGIIHLNPS